MSKTNSTLRQKIAVLVDFTDGSSSALKQADQLARKTGASITAVHVVGKNEQIEQAGKELKGFVAGHFDSPYEVKTEVVAGDLNEAVPAVMKRIEPDLVIVCSHGIKGIAQHLFGSRILHLAEVMRFPMIIIHENIKVNLSEAKSILFPIGPHDEFDIKIRQTAALAKVLGATIVMYEIETPGAASSDQLEANKAAAKKYFSEAGVASKYVLDEMKMLSAGFSRQTLAYAVENQASMISLMATVSKNDIRFGSGDKENLVNNPNGVPVLLCMA